MREFFLLAEKMVRAMAIFMLDQTELSTILILVGIGYLIFSQVKKYVGKKYTKTEQKYPELEKLKQVETETKTTGQGQFLLALTKVGLAAVALFLVMIVLT